jgi:ABC-2 type transport system ATP-binding protein
MAPSTVVIAARGLRKVFAVRSRAGLVRRVRREVEAVVSLDLSVEAGEMVGYIGPNGAGKSTTIKMMTGILSPSAGEVSVLGLRPVRQRVELARRIGVVFGQRTQLWWDLPLSDSFDLLHAVYRTSMARHRRNLEELVELLDLGPLLATPVRQLSLGQRMRGELAAALLHDPELVFLDEPTIGLDVVSKHAVRRFLAELNQRRGTTVLLTTHDLADIEQLCRRIAIVDHGRIVYDGPLDTFRQSYGTNRTVVVDLERDAAPLQITLATTLRVDGARQWVQFDRHQTSAAAVVAEVVAQQPVRDITIEEPRIEDLVRQLYEAPPHVHPTPSPCSPWRKAPPVE